MTTRVWMLLLPLLTACGLLDGGDIEDHCQNDKDCDLGLVCEKLDALGYWGGIDSDDPDRRICTQACKVDADCPTLRDDCGKMPLTCEEGFCRSLQICEG